MTPWVVMLATVLGAAPAAAASGTVEGTVKFQQKTLFGDAPVQVGDDAVVYLEPAPGSAPETASAHAPAHASDAHGQHPKLAQQDKTFIPRLLVVTAGTEVDFPNEDLLFHNVFSLSQGNEFDLGVYRRGTSKTVRFTKPGVVDVFCNIHPDMIASILVLTNSHYAKVDKDGRYRLTAPPGKYTLVAYWDRGVIEKREIEIGPQPVKVDFTLVDTGQRARHLNKFGQQYGRYK